MQELENLKKAKKSYALEQIPQQAQLAKERREELNKLIDKFSIKVDLEKELYFEQLM